MGIALVRTRRAKPGSRVSGAHAIPSPESARIAGLRHVSDDRPGIARLRRGERFLYRRPDGKAVRDAETLSRIKALAIPPAWTDVWICPIPAGHIQATGRDVRGRKQYRYHAGYRAARDETKYGRMMAFGDALPAIRRRVDEDLARPGLPREKVLAAVVRLLETTLIRVGNAAYAKENRSFGLTTLLDRHVEVTSSKLRFSFRGKSGVDHEIGLTDPRLARIVRRCRDLPGQDLFQYEDDGGERHRIGSEEINAYIREIAGGEFSAKDFRTWAGTVLAAMALVEFEAFDTQAAAKANILRAIEAVSAKLGNTPSVCRKCYIHPEIIASYLDGSIREVLEQRADRAMESIAELKPEEAATLALLRRRLARKG